MNRARFVVYLLALASWAPGLAAGEAYVNKTRRVAVLRFQNLRPESAADWIGAGAAAVLAVKVGAVPGIVVVESAQIEAILTRDQIQWGDFADPKVASEAGRDVAADRVVSAIYAARGKDVVFNLRVLDAPTGALLYCAAVRGPQAEIQTLVFRMAVATIRSFDKCAVVADGKVKVGPAPASERITLTSALEEALRKLGATSHRAYVAFSRGLAANTFKEQIARFSQAISLAPRYAWAYERRGVAYVMEGRTRDAIRDFTTAIEIRPDFAAAYQRRAAAYGAQGETRKAIRDCDKAVKLRPDFAEAYNSRGVARYEMDEMDAAVRDLSRALKIQPQWADPHGNRAAALYAKALFKQAIADCDNAIRLAPAFGRAYLIRGCAEDAMGRSDAAIRDFDTFIKLNPGSADAHQYRAMAWFAKKEYAKARQDVDTCRRHVI